MICKICKLRSKKKSVVTRSGKKNNLYFCKNCDFEFFSQNPRKKLSLNKLNFSRLKMAGLKIPSLKEDFKNGTFQSEAYVKKYLKNNEKKKNVLEIGCSFGYFLNTLKKKGFKNVYGVEINQVCKKYINQKLKIPCYSDLDEIDSEILFDKIFLFYSYEYIYKPREYLEKLFSILNKKGKIYIITPNKNDILKDLVPGSKFSNFFYDIHSINYFSVLSLKKIANLSKIKDYSIKTYQGYSLANLFHWYLNQKPIKSILVGEDVFVENLLKDIKNSNAKIKVLKNKINSLIQLFNKKYKKILAKHNFGNQIIFCVEKR